MHATGGEAAPGRVPVRQFYGDKYKHMLIKPTFKGQLQPIDISARIFELGGCSLKVV